MIADHKELAIRALEQMRGDDLERYRARWKGFTRDQMNAPYGDSQMTRSEILAILEANRAKIDRAIDWIRSL